MKKFITILTLACIALTGAQAANLSVETLAVIKHVNIHDGVSYGAGVDFGIKLNSFVTGHVRAVAYEENNWRGSAIDTGSLLVEAQLFQSANKKVSLSAIGGVNRHFGVDDWGLAVGPRFKVALTKNISIVAEEQIEARIKGGKNLNTFAGLNFSF